MTEPSPGMVLVPYEVLERIIFAASAVKTVEGGLAAWKRDPFVIPHLDFTEAQKLAEAIMRRAKRASLGTAVGWDDPLTKTEENALRYVSSAINSRRPGLNVFAISGADKDENGGEIGGMSVYDRLAAKGHIEIGQFVEGIVWPGAETAQILADPQRGYAARITARGRALLIDLDKARGL